MNASAKKPIQEDSRRFARSFMASRPGHTAQVIIILTQPRSPRSRALRLSSVKFSPCCDQRPQPIFMMVTYEKESLMKNIDFPQKLISNLKQIDFREP